MARMALPMNSPALAVRLRLAIVAVCLAVASPAWSGPYQDGLAALARGDYGTALTLFKPLAASGDANSQFQLSLLYAYGRGVAVDSKQAMHWLQQAAVRGNVSAQSNLGVAFNMGRVIPQNLVKSYAWLSIAASQEDSVAKTNRDIVAKKLTPVQLERAKALAQECAKGNLAGCL